MIPRNLAAERHLVDTRKLYKPVHELHRPRMLVSYIMGSMLSRARMALRREGYAQLSSVEGGDDDAPCAAQCALEARSPDLPSGPVIVMRARMLCSASDESQSAKLPVPALVLGGVEEDIGPARLTVTTPTQDKILAELGLPSEPAWGFADE